MNRSRRFNQSQNSFFFPVQPSPFPSLSPSTYFLRSALYADTGAGKSTVDSEEKKTEAASVFSFKHFLSFPLHHYERTGNPAYKSRGCMCTLSHAQSRRINSRSLFCGTWDTAGDHLGSELLSSLLLETQTHTQVLVWCLLRAIGEETACTLSRSFTCQPRSDVK